MPQYITSFLFLLFTTLYFSNSTILEASEIVLKQARTHIVIGSEFDYAPYALVTKAGEADGFSVDLIKAVCDAMEINYTFQVGSWSDVREALEKQQIDALPLVGYTKERDILFDFTKPHTPSYGIIFKRENTAAIESLDELKGKAIIAMKSDNTHDYLINNQITDNIITVDTVEDIFKSLNAKIADYAIGPRLVGLLILQKQELKNIVVTGPLIKAYGSGFSFAVHQNDTILLSLLNQGLSVVKANGTYDKIYKKWFGIIDTQTETLSDEEIKIILFSIGSFIFVILIVFVWSISLRRKVLEKTCELQASQQLYEDLYDNSPDMYCSVDAHTTYILQCNQTLAKKLGIPKKQLIGHPIFNVYHPDCMEDVKEAFKKFTTVGTVNNAELMLKTAKGEKIDVILNISAVRDSDGKILHSRSSWRDVTEQRLAKESLQKSEEKFRSLINTAPVVILYLSTDYLIKEFNPEAEKFYKKSREEVLGKNYLDLFIPQEAQDAIIADITKVLSGTPTIGYENEIVLADGSIKVLLWNVVPFMETESKVAGIIAAAQDISKRKEVEEELNSINEELNELNKNLEKKIVQELNIRLKNEQLLIQQSKMAAMGEMIGSIAHQWRQPLNGLGLLIQNLEEDYDDGELNKESLHKMVESSMSEIFYMSETINDFRSFFKKSKKKVLFSIHDAILDTIKLSEVQLKNHFIKLNYQNTVQEENNVIGYPNEFKQVLLNIVSNSKDAIVENCPKGYDDEGNIGNIILAKECVKNHLIITIKDTGGGISKEVMNRIFEPYFTTKDEGKGTGIGLYMSKTIIEKNMGGTLTVKNEGKGTIFTIILIKA